MTGIQAMEQSVYSCYPSRRRGECHSLEATARFEALVRRGGERIRLAAQNPDAMAGKRLRRWVAVPIDGKWRAIGTARVSEGHALWLPNGGGRMEPHLQHARPAGGARRPAAVRPQLLRRRARRHRPGQHAARTQRSGQRPRERPRRVRRIRTNNARPLSLAGWRFRDSALRWYTFPSRASVPADRSIRVRMVVGRSTSSVFFWDLDSPPFENDADGGHLFDRQGDLRAWDIYSCRVGC